MDTSIYEKLAAFLDDLPGGFPRTDSQVEIRILKKLFTPKQAKLALCLNLIPESPVVIAYRAGLGINKTADMLGEMAEKGLILKISSNALTKYMALQFVVGIWEYQVARLDAELVADMEAYIPFLFDAKSWQKAPQMRTIPVGRSIDARLTVLPHEKAEALINEKDDFVISPCICRKERQIAGKGCDKPIEACISFGGAGSYYLENKIGRRADRNEVLDLIRLADKKGLVLQPTNGKNISWICCCCGCCCGILRTLKTYPNPSELAASPFVAVLDASECTGCGICETRCQMDAFIVSDKKAVLNKKRCIGCGLCVSTCPASALKLERKPDRLQPPVPGSMAMAALKLAWKRKKLGPAKLATMILKSKKDRFMANR